MRKKASSDQASYAGDAFARAATVAPDEKSETARPASQPEFDGGIKWRAFYALIPVALAVIVSINTLSNDFASDDVQQVLNNDFIKKFSNLPVAFASSVWAFTSVDIVYTVDPYYRPLFSALFTLNYALFGSHAWGWHLINLLIHAAVTYFVFAAIKEATGRKWLAVITASLFAVHPAHAESVAWVSGVTDPLMGLFLIPAFYFYARWRRQGRNYRLVVALALYFLALLCKEAALALPVMVAYCELFYFNNSLSFNARFKRFALLSALFAVPSAIYFLMRYHAINALFGGSPRYPLVFGIATIPLATIKYLALILIPANYSYQHYTPLVETVATLRLAAPLVLLAALIAAIILSKSQILKFAAAWFAIMLLPVLAALQQFEPGYLVQERYLYIPSIGACLALALGIEWMAKRKWFGADGYKAAAAAALLLVVLFGAVHFKQNKVWQDSVTLYKRCIEVAPQSSVAHSIMSRIYYDAGRPREAEAESRVALELDGTNTGAYLNLSYFSRASGKLDKAIEYIEQAVSNVPLGPSTRNDLATAYLNLGLLCLQQKDLNRAEANLLKSIEISPRPVAWYHAGQFYYEQERFADAQRLFEMTEAQTPKWFSPIYIKLGQTYESLGQIDRARAEYEKFLKFAPPDSPDIKSVQNHLKQLDTLPQRP
jgi:protein O-mannosyl-transferase